MLRHNLVPEAPSQGSVDASGDLAAAVLVRSGGPGSATGAALPGAV